MIGMRWAGCGVALVLAGCVDEGAQSADGSTGQSTSSTTESPVTLPDVDTTAAPEGSSTAADDSPGTMIPDTESSSEGDGSSSSSSSSSSSGSESSSGESSSSSSSSSGDASSSSSSSSSTGEPDLCMAIDLGNALPTTAFADNTGAGDDYAVSCFLDAGGEDVMFTWTAPAAGTYYFTTSRPGTLLASSAIALLDGDCEAAELACGVVFIISGFDGFATATLAAGQTITVVVDAYDSTVVGPFELYIDVYPDAQDGGSCCNATGVGGCDTEAIEDCVCAIHPECCDGTWSAYCGQLSYQVCNAQCSCWEYPTCPAPHDDCVCMGCTVDGICNAQDDCIDCPDCAGSPLCGCNDDDVCDPYGESCECADCADEAVCA